MRVPRLPKWYVRGVQLGKHSAAIALDGVALSPTKHLAMLKPIIRTA